MAQDRSRGDEGPAGGIPSRTAPPPGSPPWHAALLTPAGRALVESLTPFDPREALRVVERARRDPAWAGRPDVVAAAATQAQARTRAAQRFPGPPRWWTPQGLEQATRPVVARRHAQRYVDAGIREVADLGCGAGSDCLALALAGIRVSAVDRDPDALWALASTAADLGLSVRTIEADVVDLVDDRWLRGLGPGSGCFVDPARRTERARALQPESWSPPWSWVRHLADRVPAIGAKVAPGIPHGALPAQAQAEWVSVDGDLVEAGVWWGPLRRGPARRVASVVTSSGAAAQQVTSIDDAAGVPVPAVGPIGAWLVEPDPAVIRSGLVGLVAGRLGGRLLDPHIAYVTSESRPADSPLYARFEVLEEVPFARRALRAWLRARGFGNVVVKKRGVDVVPEELRSWLRLDAGGPTATLVLTRTGSGPVGWWVRRG